MKKRSSNKQSGVIGELGDRWNWALESRALATKILNSLNKKVVESDTISRILDMVGEFTKVEAVGIKPKSRPEDPCRPIQGFSEQFLECENSVCRVSGGAPALRDAGELTVLECIGGAMTGGTIDESLPFFSSGGSFWTNNLSELLSSPEGWKIEGRCGGKLVTDGYESIALIPIYSTGAIVALLQLKDARTDCFSTEMIQFFEAIAAIIGVVLARVSAEEALKKANDELDLRVQERTEELLAANYILSLEIQDKMAVERQLMLSQQRFELAMQAGDLGSWEWNIATGEVYFDKRWTEMTGFSLEESAPHYSTWQQLLHPEDRPKLLKKLMRCVKKPDCVYESEYRLRTKSGEWKWIMDRGKVVEMDDAGKAKKMGGIYLNVTERKKVEEELHQSEERLRTIFENAKDCIYIKDSSMRYSHVNPSFCGMLDLATEQIVGRSDGDLFGKDSGQILKDADLRVLNGESIEQEQTRQVRGAPRTLLDVKVPMRNRIGEIIGIFGIIRDITDRISTHSAVEPLVRDYISGAMRHTLHQARLAAQTDIFILLTGESGAGKDHIARYIHDHSRRAAGPFFSINCAAISPELFESELFGYEPGAFTGARNSKRGLLELAEGGTILLNEIGELSLHLQSKLLTFLDSRQFTRVGGVKSLSVNARLIAATNRDLEKEVKRDRFRHDLYYRLNVFSVEVPALRERAEDLPVLIADILRPLAANVGLEEIPQIEPAALTAMLSYNWPGNVRELRNVLERAFILCDKRTIRLNDLALHNKRGPAANDDWSLMIKFPQDQSLNEATRDFKRNLIEEALKRTKGRRKRAAEMLGISPDALKHYMQSFDLYGRK
jgi:two-component system response regulator AtoC